MDIAMNSIPVSTRYEKDIGKKADDVRTLSVQLLESGSQVQNYPISLRNRLSLFIPSVISSLELE